MKRTHTSVNPDASGVSQDTDRHTQVSVRPTRRWLSIFIALLLVVVVGVWMGSGVVGKQPEPLPESTRVEETLAPTRVWVQTPFFEQVNRLIEITGQTAPNRSVYLRAATSGTVVVLEVKKGDLVEEGQLLIRLDAAARDSQLAEAKALERQEQLHYDSVTNLVAKGLASKLELTQANARLESARARVRSAREALGDTRIAAPFAGLITSQSIELGDYLSPGREMLEISEITPTLVTASLSERDLAALDDQQPDVAVQLATGEQLAGTLSYISPGSTSSTNTFPIEITLQQKARVRLGVTAEVQLALAAVPALKLRPDQLELNASGDMVVKYVDSADQVGSARVELLRASEGNVWVAADLPAEVRIIGTGSGFTQIGEVVEPVERLASDTPGHDSN